MKIAILVLALATMVYTAPNSDMIEKEVADRLDKLQEDLSIMKQMMTDMDESEVATQAIEQVQRHLEEASAQIFYIGRWIKRR